MSAHTLTNGTPLLLPALSLGATLAGWGDAILRMAQPILTLLFIFTGLAFITYPWHHSMKILKPVGLAMLSFLVIPSVIHPLGSFPLPPHSKPMAFIVLGILALLFLLQTKVGRLMFQPVIGLGRGIITFLIITPAKKRGPLFALWWCLLMVSMGMTAWTIFYPSKHAIIAVVILWIAVILMRLLFGRYRQGMTTIRRHRLPGRQRRRS